MCDNWFDLLASHSLLSEGPDIAQGDRPPVTRLSVVEVNGINEKYYFHVIYRERHSMLASLIGNDIQEGLGK